MAKSLVQMRVARYPIWAVYVGMLIIAANGNSKAEETLDVTTVIVEAVEHRLSMVVTLKGRVLLRYVHSDRYNAATSRSRAASAANRGLDAGAMPPLERNHLSLSDFEYDIEMQRWRREVVDLINSGRDWHRTGYATLLNSDLDPSYYYNYSLCDGEKVYTYKRSTNQGSVDYYQNLNQLPSDLWQIPARIVTMISIDVLRALQHHGHVAIQLSNENIEGIHCLRLRIDPPSQETESYNSKIMARLWIAPALGYAVVREERLVLDLSNTPLRFSVSTNSNFVELMPGLWCPKYARTDRFFYTSFFWGELDEQRSYAGPTPRRRFLARRGTCAAGREGQCPHRRKHTIFLPL